MHLFPIPFDRFKTPLLNKVSISWNEWMILQPLNFWTVVHMSNWLVKKWSRGGKRRSWRAAALQSSDPTLIKTHLPVAS